MERVGQHRDHVLPDLGEDAEAVRLATDEVAVDEEGMAAVLDLLDEKKLNIQMVMLMMYMMVSFFGGTVADDEATKKAAAAKEKVK